MKYILDFIPNKWKWSAVLAIGGVMLGAGLADSIFAVNDADLNQVARGLTIFSAGLTILVLVDNSKKQQEADSIQKDTQQRLEKIEAQLSVIEQSQQLTEQQLKEIKELLVKQSDDKEKTAL